MTAPTLAEEEYAGVGDTMRVVAEEVELSQMS